MQTLKKNVSSHGGVFVLSKFWDLIIVFSSFRSFVFFFEFHDFVIYRHPVRMFQCSRILQSAVRATEC